MYIENICWVYDKQPDGSMTLKRIEFPELKKIKALNRTVPKDERRYFIEDYCRDGSVCECLNLEVTRERYKLWRRMYRSDTKAFHAESDAGVTLISLDTCINEAERGAAGDAVLSAADQEERLVPRMDLERFWDSLTDAGKDYLREMLAYYHENGGVWGSGAYIAERYGVFRRMVSHYHAELREIAAKELGYSV